MSSRQQYLTPDDMAMIERVFARRFAAGQVLPFLPTPRHRVAWKLGPSHRWARELTKLLHTVRLMPPA